LACFFSKLSDSEALGFGSQCQHGLADGLYSFMGTILVTKNNAQFCHIQVWPGSLYQALVDGIEHCAAGKN